MLSLIAFFVRIPFFMLAFVTRERPTHRNGVAGAGTFRVDEGTQVPANSFFRPGREMAVALRHANLDFSDDARLDIRGGAVRLTADDGEVLDLPMNTGEINTFQTAWVFLEFMACKPWGTLGYRWFAWRYPRIWRMTVDACRRGPSSYAELRYHGQLIFRFAAEDQRPRFARYRLVPSRADVEEPGPDAADHRHPFRQRRAPGDDRSKTYLREEYLRRVSGPGAHYRLEVQLHDAADTDPPEVFDTSRVWDATSHPWLLLGEIVIDRALSDAETRALRFNIANQPTCLGVLPARSASDFNSPGFLRTLAYVTSQRGRLGRAASEEPPRLST